MNAQLSTEQLFRGRPGVIVARAEAASHCKWCGNAFTAAGEIIDHTPADLASLPKVPCRLCERLENIFKDVPKEQVPMTRVQKFEAGVIEVGKPDSKKHEVIAVARRLQAVEMGRSCLPEGDRD